MDPEERQLLQDTYDLSKSTNQTVHEVLMPAIQGNGGPGLLQRVDGLESDRDGVRGFLKAFGVLVAVLSLVSVLLSAYAVVAT